MLCFAVVLLLVDAGLGLEDADGVVAVLLGDELAEEKRKADAEIQFICERKIDYVD